MEWKHQTFQWESRWHFSEVIKLITDKEYMLVKTTSSDHATGNVGTIFHPQNAKELYALVVEQSQFTLVRTIPKTRLQSRDVVVDILEIFLRRGHSMKHSRAEKSIKEGSWLDAYAFIMNTH